MCFPNQGERVRSEHGGVDCQVFVQPLRSSTDRPFNALKQGILQFSMSHHYSHHSRGVDSHAQLCFIYRIWWQRPRPGCFWTWSAEVQRAGKDKCLNLLGQKYAIKSERKVKWTPGGTFHFFIVLFAVWKLQEFQVNYVVPHQVTKERVHRFAMRLAYRRMVTGSQS